MKYFTLIILLVIIAGTSCTTSNPATGNINDSVLMTIDCRNEADLKQVIVMRLRGTKARNLQITQEGGFLKIRTVFLKREVSAPKLFTLAQDIQNLGGVLQTLMEENRGTVVQVIDIGPVN